MHDREAMKKSKRIRKFTAAEENNQENEFIPNQSQFKKSILHVSILALVITMLTSFVVTSYLDDGSAEEVVANRVSTSTSAGEKLFIEESNDNIEARDFEVTNAGGDGGEARMLIWDFNLEDLDEVSILVDGVPVKEKLIISNNAASISIPVPSTVTVVGVKDNGGGISYAVKFPNNKTTYFNTVSVGQSNTYTVLPSL